MITIKDRNIGPGEPCYLIAEVSCNHEGDIDEAKRIIKAAAEAGCDAAKIQTYTADSITRNFKNKPKGTIWEDTDLYALYEKAHTPWNWYTELKKTADEHNIHLFSSPFDETAVDFLEEMDVPAYKIASFEIVDTKLIEKVAKTGKPVILSTGMAYLEEIEEAHQTLIKNGTKQIAVLQCNSGYPGEFGDANLATIPAIAEKFKCISGLSDHIIFADSQIENCNQAYAHVTPLEAVKLGANIIEFHLTLDRDKARKLMEAGGGGFDWPFSRTPNEVKKMVRLIRAYESGQETEYETDIEKELAKTALGEISFTPTAKEEGSRNIRPSLWVVENIKAGDKLEFAAGKNGNFDSIRPAGGLHIRHTDELHGQTAKTDVDAGTPLSWDIIGKTGN